MSILKFVFNNLGPYGEQDDEQLFVQQIVPDSDELYVRLASTGKRYATINFRYHFKCSNKFTCFYYSGCV